LVITKTNGPQGGIRPCSQGAPKNVPLKTGPGGGGRNKTGKSVTWEEGQDHGPFVTGPTSKRRAIKGKEWRPRLCSVACTPKGRVPGGEGGVGQGTKSRNGNRRFFLLGEDEKKKVNKTLRQGIAVGKTGKKRKGWFSKEGVKRGREALAGDRPGKGRVHVVNEKERERKTIPEQTGGGGGKKGIEGGGNHTARTSRFPENTVREPLAQLKKLRCGRNP